MTTKHILSLAAIALATLSTTGCQELIALAEKARSLQNGTNAMGGTTALTAATAASPSSIAGKKIVLDYSTAQNSEGDSSNYPNISWGPWKKCDPSKTTTPTFGKNNRYERRGSYADDYVIWTYKKTGGSTAEVTTEAHEYYETFRLTFDSPTTGTATGGTEDDCNGYNRIRNIRFTIK